MKIKDILYRQVSQECMLQNMDEKIEFIKQERGAQVHFSKKDFTIAEVIAKVMGIVEVRDVQIQETELTDIVKKIYQSGVRKGL